MTAAVSIIVPVLNEARALPETLRRIGESPVDHEIIVADGGSHDETLTIAASFPKVTCISAPPGRASQMNAAARIARGPWLLFLHADTRLPASALQSIVDLGKDELVQAGGFRHRFSGDNPGLRLISWINNLRCRRTRIFYGDQAPFVRRTLFMRIGGFPETRMLEDVLFMEKLNKSTRPVMLPDCAVTDSRRFVQDGIWRSFGRVFMILSCHKLGLRIPASKFFEPVR